MLLKPARFRFWAPTTSTLQEGILERAVRPPARPEIAKTIAVLRTVFGKPTFGQTVHLVYADLQTCAPNEKIDNVDSISLFNDGSRSHHE